MWHTLARPVLSHASTKTTFRSPFVIHHVHLMNSPFVSLLSISLWGDANQMNELEEKTSVRTNCHSREKIIGSKVNVNWEVQHRMLRNENELKCNPTLNANVFVGAPLSLPCLCAVFIHKEIIYILSRVSLGSLNVVKQSKSCWSYVCVWLLLFVLFFTAVNLDPKGRCQFI